MIGAGFLNLPHWQGKLQQILGDLRRPDLFRLPVLGTENVEHPWVALESGDFYSAISTGIIFNNDHRINRFPEKLVCADAEVALKRLYAEKNRNTWFKAAIGATFPFLKILASDQVEAPVRIYVQNDAVASFILSHMETESCSLDKAVAAAQWEKVATSNPNPSLHGIVTRNRLVLQIAEIFGFAVPAEKVFCNGIGSICSDDIRVADSLGYSIRLLGMAEKGSENLIKASVEPCLIPRKFFLAQARGGSEIIYSQSESGQSQVFACPGTCEESVVRGILTDLEEIKSSANHDKEVVVLDSVSDFSGRYYIRLELVNLTSTLAQVLNLIAANGIEVDSINQPSVEVSRETESSRPIVLLTAKTDVDRINNAISMINEQIKLASVCSYFKLLR